ncbi:MAG: AAA family ATPase [Prevotellaceae bacterium]|jgi:AAA+ ATPase superfamily predicted ATPase|nr:AAA family ATPase [Prevotellaceae bacterium]
MEKNVNPFLTIGYVEKDYFCDRENEVEAVCKNVENGMNTTLISARRLGKSALIHRIFEEFEDSEDENYACLYVDIYACTNLKSLTEALALAIFNKFPAKRSIGKRFFDFLKNLRPIITYDALTGQPEIHFELAQAKEYEHTLRSLLQFLDSQQVDIVLAVDEFQQVADFPEKNVEALLRTIIQTLKNTQFIFSGSKKHLMLEMFTAANRPFFSSTQMLGLSEIPADKYAAFIREKFAERSRSISSEAVEFILSWTLRHTYYTQTICNRAFAEGKKSVGIEQVKRVCDEQLNLQQVTYMQYRSLLSPIQ